MTELQTLCVACHQPIPAGARKCSHCSEYQSHWRHAHNGLTLLSLLVAVLTSAALLISEWDRFALPDSDVNVDLTDLVVAAIPVDPKLHSAAIEVRPSGSLPTNSIYAYLVFTNNGEKDAVVRGIHHLDEGGSSPTLARDFVTREMLQFPLVLKSGESRVLHVYVGDVRTISLFRASDERLAQMVHDAGPDESGITTFEDGYAYSLLNDGVDLIRHDLRVHLLNHRGTRESFDLTITDDLTVAALRDGRDRLKKRWGEELPDLKEMPGPIPMEGGYAADEPPAPPSTP